MSERSAALAVLAFVDRTEDTLRKQQRNGTEA